MSISEMRACHKGCRSPWLASMHLAAMLLVIALFACKTGSAAEIPSGEYEGNCGLPGEELPTVGCSRDEKPIDVTMHIRTAVTVLLWMLALWFCRIYLTTNRTIKWQGRYGVDAGSGFQEVALRGEERESVEGNEPMPAIPVGDETCPAEGNEVQYNNNIMHFLESQLDKVQKLEMPLWASAESSEDFTKQVANGRRLLSKHRMFLDIRNFYMSRVASEAVKVICVHLKDILQEWRMQRQVGIEENIPLAAVMEDEKCLHNLLSYILRGRDCEMTQQQRARWDAIKSDHERKMRTLMIIDENEIQLHEVIGAGGMGVVHRAELGTADVAVKKTEQVDELRVERLAELIKEGCVHASLNHGNIVQLYGTTMSGWIVMERADTNLWNLCHKGPKLPWSTILNLLQQGADALTYMHSRDPVLVHSDVKPQNFLIFGTQPDNFLLKVSDFGVSFEERKTRANTVRLGGGTPEYIAPEISLDKPLTKESDVFSFGVVLFEVFSRNHPYGRLSRDVKVLFLKKDREEDPCPVGYQDCPPQMRDLMKRCCAADPCCRPTMAEVSHRLRQIPPDWVPPQEPTMEDTAIECRSVGTSQEAAKCSNGGTAQRAMDKQDMSLFTSGKLGGPESPTGMFRSVSAQSNVEVEGHSSQEVNGEELCAWETELELEVDARVSVIWKPWLRESWSISGEISTITEEMNKNFTADILKDVFSHSTSAESAARHLLSYRLSLQCNSDVKQFNDLFNPGERDRALAFSVSLEDELKSLYAHQALKNVPGIQVPDSGIAAVDAIRNLKAVKDVLLGVLELTKRQGVGSSTDAGLVEMQVDQYQQHCARTASMVVAFPTISTPGSVMSLKRLVAEISQRKIIWPMEQESDVSILAQAREEDLVKLIDFALQGITDLEFYGAICWGNTAGTLLYGSHAIVEPGTFVELDTGHRLVVPVLHIGHSAHLACSLRQAVSSNKELTLLPQVYQLQPTTKSMRTYLGGERFLEDECCKRIRKAALKNKHGMAFILVDRLVVILNFKTSNACIFSTREQVLEGFGSVETPNGCLLYTREQVLEGACTIAGCATAVHDLGAYDAFRIDCSREIPQVNADEVAEVDEWEGSAQVAAATWLQQTYLVLVGNCWYIRLRNSRWEHFGHSMREFVKQHRIAGISVLFEGFAWDTVIVKDGTITKLLSQSKVPKEVWQGWPIQGSQDIEGIVRATAGTSVHLNDSLFRLCRSIIEMSIAQAPDILLVVHGKFSSWCYLYPRNEQEGQEKSVFDYSADEPHQLGGRSLLLLEARDGYYIRLRDVATVLLQRWCKLRNAPDSPILDLDGSFKDDSDLTLEEKLSAKLFDATDRVVSIGGHA